ncbi:MAG: glycosyltransferase N-terminal domain-containing protein, partial [Alphaproteobacteria bacterium]|nr:glycosyltransferase N-terminal domain-containing protein [Alphaproteobacteria bacterium]
MRYTARQYFIRKFLKMIPLFLYRVFVLAATPFLWVLLGVRCLRGKEDVSRLRERLGFPAHPRPAGRLVWIHGASVGECLSFLPLIHKILAADATARVMVTSGTRTSAQLMAQRLPDRAFHQFIPVDFWGAARRFARHFKPDAVLWFESDFWPNMMAAAASRRIPFILLNGRISDRSFARWQRFRWFIAPLLRRFTLAFGQTDEDARRL